MKYKIVADSCCDMTAELKERLDAISIPLTITMSGKNFVDDESLDMAYFMNEMENCQSKIETAAPSPTAYKDAFEGDYNSFAVTLSGNLSSSNSSANIGKDMLTDEDKEKVHVFDSKSASAGEILIALKIRQLIDEGVQRLKIIEHMENFIKNMKTFFVLDNINNLLKNGRLNHIVGKIVSMFGIKPLMGSDGNGNIALFSYARGEKQIIEKLSDTVRKSGKKTDGKQMVITHCENLPLAKKLMETIKARYNFKEILIVPTRGLSSVYANSKGIIIAF
jgi:DegV family protein with EDD domain